MTVSALLNHVIDGLGHGTDSTAGRQGSYVGKTGNACWKNGLTLMLNGCFNNNCTENSDPRVIYGVFSVIRYKHTRGPKLLPFGNFLLYQRLKL